MITYYLFSYINSRVHIPAPRAGNFGYLELSRVHILSLKYEGNKKAWGVLLLCYRHKCIFICVW